MTTAKLRNLIADEARRLIMCDLRHGCGTCHWATPLMIQWAKELTKRKPLVRSQEGRKL